MKRALLLPLLLAATPAFAHPGHGAEPDHVHPLLNADYLLVALVAALVVGIAIRASIGASRMSKSRRR